jgi:tetratricopeptide (TPR) repeat protein
MAKISLNYRYYFRQQPVMLALLSLIIVVAFLGVAGLSRAYHAQREALGSRWFNRGVADLRAKNFAAAATEFRAALLYSRDDYSYQLNLAEALIGLKHTGEASAYLLNLWDREPEDGLVNLELARIAAQQAQTAEAVRHYHDAVYAAWPPEQEAMRTAARLELIELLLRINARAQAQSESIALAENLGDDPAQQERLAALFLRAQDYPHALAAFRLSLKSDPHDAVALAGAGRAAFEMGQYPLAQHYLQEAVSINPNDTQSADRLKTAEMVIELDPFRRQISLAQRNRSVLEAFATAGDRLKTCAAPESAATGTSGSQPALSDSYAALKPRMTEQDLRKNPDLAESAMDLAFRIERQTSSLCGTPTGKDLALLLVSKLHEGN